MNLPPMPQTRHTGTFGYNGDDMQAYAELCIAEYKRQKAAPLIGKRKLFNDAQIAEIRRMYWAGAKAKDIRAVFPMAEASFYNIVMNRGAYK